jgi:uncharacterized protein (DUF302 family)
MKLSRYWMTGCMALVLMVAGRGSMASMRGESETEERRGWISSASQQPLDETVRRLQLAARRHGFQVMVNMPASGVASCTERVLVLGRHDGRTPVVQSGGEGAAHGVWDLPLRLLVQTLPDGSTRVAYGDPTELSAPEGLPSDMLQDMAALPAIVSAALGSGPPTSAASDVNRGT